MNIIIDVNSFSINNTFFYDPIKNNIIDNSNFVRLIYSDKNLILNGLYLQISLDNHFDSSRFSNELESIENSILTKYNTTIEKMNKIKVQFLYILKYIKHNRLILKISGIWENNNKIGLTYKFIY
jgi:hypothetical protein